MRSFLFWTIAILITLASAYYQRVTGPTYPIDDEIEFDGLTVQYTFERSHSTSNDYEVTILTDSKEVNGILKWKRYKTDDPWTEVEMLRSGNKLVAPIPKQPKAGKIKYRLSLTKDGKQITLPEDDSVVIRFKGDVPLWILIPHIIAMFGTMLLSTRTGLEVFNKELRLKLYTKWTLGFLIAGGMILGPLTQLYAFDALWTGFPFGMDLTDNKTLIALIFWIVAAFAVFKNRNPKMWVIVAAIVTFIIFLIPHSMFGSELDYEKMDKKKQAIVSVSKTYGC